VKHLINSRLDPLKAPLAASLALVLMVLAPAPADGSDADPVAAIIDRALADTFTLEALRELCDEVGPRLAGSEGMRRAHGWAERWLAEAGADTVWAEPVTIPRWQRGREWVRLVEPYEMPLGMLGLGMSVGTGGRPLTAEVLAVTDWDELEARADEAAGRIVVFNPPWTSYGPNVQYRSRGPSVAAAHGAVATLIRPAGFGRNTPHTGVLRYDPEQPQIPAASLTEEGAALLWRLDRAGLRPRVELFMEAEPLEPGPCANIVGELRGRERPDEIVLIAGHLDAWDTGQGAHDDGAGCAIMIGALKVLRDLDLRPRRTIRVVLYTSEEYGGQGGVIYAEEHPSRAMPAASLRPGSRCGRRRRSSPRCNPSPPRWRAWAPTRSTPAGRAWTSVRWWTGAWSGSGTGCTARSTSASTTVRPMSSRRSSPSIWRPTWRPSRASSTVSPSIPTPT